MEKPGMVHQRLVSVVVRAVYMFDCTLVYSSCVNVVAVVILSVGTLT